MQNRTFFLQILLIVLSGLFISKSSYSFDAERIITTSHFIISYTVTDSNPALVLASELEISHNIISGFIEIDPLEKIHVNLSGGSSIIDSGAELKILQGVLYVPMSENFNTIKNKLYSKLFYIYLQKLMHYENLTVIPGENLVEAIIQYPLMERHVLNAMLYDLVNIEKITAIDPGKIDRFNKYQQGVIYNLFIDFIISSYGKKILIQSLKDTVYYSGLINSISMITGDTSSAIADNFNLWLLKFNAENRLESLTEKKSISAEDGFQNCAYSISENGLSALLQLKDNSYRIFIKNTGAGQILKLAETENNSYYNEIVFMNENQLIIIEVVQNGSRILLYDISKKEFSKAVLIPYLFISEAASSENNMILFSADCGAKSDIYTYNIYTEQLEILTVSGINRFPVRMNKKVFCISGINSGSIVELYKTTGESRVLFSAERRISYLKKVNEETVTFLMNINGRDSMYIMNVLTGNMQKINLNDISILKPQISGRYLYFFSFYKSKYQFFSTLYSADTL